MANGWQEVLLGKVLKRADRFEKKDEMQTYHFAGTYSFARGIFAGEVKEGSTFGLDKIQRIKKGDFIYCKIMAWEGAFGIAPEKVDNCVMSGAFVAYEVDQTQIYPKFLDYYFKQEPVWKSIGSQSTGTNVRRRSLNPDQFEKATIPFPPLDEQRQIVERIEALATRIITAQSLRKEIWNESELLLRSILVDKSFGEPTLVPMKELVELREPDVIVEPNETYHFAGVYSFGRGIFRGIRKKGNQFAYKKLSRLRTNDFTYPKLMAWEGAYAIVSPECDGLVVSTEFPVFELNQEKILPETMGVYFRNPAIWETLSGQSTGTNVRRRRLNPQTFLNYEFPLPPMKQQLVLRSVQARLASLRELQSATGEELSALLPSVLDRAFKGEL